ncbi:MAG: ATP-binding protein [Rhodothalassiaceae bacterium]
MRSDNRRHAPGSGLVAALKRHWRQFRWRRDVARRRFPGETGQIRMRLLYAIGIWLYILIALVAFGEFLPDLSMPVRIVAVGTLVALALPVHLLLTLRQSHVRRIVGLVHDIGALSLFMHFGGAVTAPFFPVYLWIALGNGFRFGVGYLLASGAFSVVCFALVIATTSIWREQLLLSSGLLGSLIVIPAYVASLIRQLHRARAEAERASAAKSEFLATVSHEVRTPLNAIIGLSDILRAAPLEGEQRQMVRAIGTAGRALLELMSDILNLARIEAGREVRRDEAVSLFHLVAELEAIAAPLAREKGLVLSTQVAPGVPRHILVDRRHLQKVLINLLVNAVKFTDRGAVRLRIGRGGAAAGDMLLFTVADSGRGIPEDEQGRIFESFTQSRHNRRDSDGGAGLGLAIVRRLVELMDGAVALESRVGAGASFTVSIPCRPADGEAPAATRQLAATLFVSGGASGTVRRLFGEVFSGLVEVAETAALPDVVLQRCRVCGERPVVFLDEDACDAATLGDVTGRLERLGLFRSPLIVLLRGQETAARDAPLPPAVLTAVPRQAGRSEREQLLALLATLLDQEAEPAPDTLREEVEGGPRLRILVAEDNRVNRQIAQRILEQLGHEVVCAEDGEAVLEVLETEAFDAILMDVNMPGMGGLEATQMIRAMEGSDRHTPVIGLTADATVAAERLCAEAGMDAVTHKPVSPQAIRTVLARVLPERPASSADKATAANVVSHPQLQKPRARVVDTEKLAELEALCPDGLFDRLKTEFIEDAETLFGDIRDSVLAQDLKTFRDTAHAIRSMAANMGALRLLALCDRCRRFGPDTLRAEGETFLAELAHEIALLRAALLGEDDAPGIRHHIKDGA